MDNNVTRLMQQIIEATSRMDMPNAFELAEYLAYNGVISVPVKVGQTVYQMVEPEFNDGEGIVCAWKVSGIMLRADGKLCALDGGNEDYEIGGIFCRLTREEAERDLREYLMGDEGKEGDADECEKTPEGD